MASAKGGKKNQDRNKGKSGQPYGGKSAQITQAARGSAGRSSASPGKTPQAQAGVFRFRLDVTLLEDLHSGTGHTAGDLDGVQMKDRDGLPMISRDHLKGLLRDAAEELADLGEATPTDVTALFGAPHADGQGKLTITSLYQSSADHNCIEWTSTARLEGGRGPMGDTLRVVEYVRAGTKLTALMELVTRAGQEELKPLLEASCRRVVALGSGRRVGDGRIQSKFDTLSLEPAPFLVPAARKLRSSAPRATGQFRLRLLLRNLVPICFPMTGDPGNLIPSACYMSGSAHRGAWISALADLGHDAASLLEGEGPAFLDAVPLPPDTLTDSLRLGTIEAIPIPLDHPTRKPPPQRADAWPWWGEEGSVTPGDELKPKRPGDMEFLCRLSSEAPWLRYTPDLRVHLRNNTGDRRRRNLTKQSLFSVEEIAERTDFLTEIEFPHAEAAAEFLQGAKPILEGRKWLRLGRGGAPAVITGHLWLGAQEPHSLPTGQDSLSLVLTSDTIIRGPRLGYLTDLGVAEILALAGVPGAEREVLAAEVTLKDKKMDTTTVHGFNAVSGLPRQPALAIRRGSTFTLSAAPTAITRIWNGLAACLGQGLGERRQEGYGRFRLEVRQIGPSLPRVVEVGASVEIGRREQAISEGEVLGIRLARGSGQPQWPSTGQVEQFRRGIMHCNSIQQIEALIAQQRQHAGTVGGEAWKGFGFGALDRRNSRFANDLAGWQTVLDTALRVVVRDSAKQRTDGVDR